MIGIVQTFYCDWRDSDPGHLSIRVLMGKEGIIVKQSFQRHGASLEDVDKRRRVLKPCGMVGMISRRLNLNCRIIGRQLFRFPSNEEMVVFKLKI